MFLYFIDVGAFLRIITSQGREVGWSLDHGPEFILITRLVPVRLTFFLVPDLDASSLLLDFR